MTRTTTKAVVGVDLGAESTKVVVGIVPAGSKETCDYTYEIVRNQVGGHTTPTMVSLAEDAATSGLRSIGATANPKSKNLVYHLNRFLDGERPSSDLFGEFYPFVVQGEGTSAVVPLNYQGNPKDFSAAALVAMLVGQIQKDVDATVRRKLEGEAMAAPIEYSYAFCLPPGASEAAQQQLLDAAYAGVPSVTTVGILPRPEAYRALYDRKFPDQSTKAVVVVDMGHTETTVSVLGPVPTAMETKDETKEEKAEDPSSKAPTTTRPVLASVRRQGLGGGTVDLRIWKHFVATLPSLKGLKEQSRGGRRLLQGTTKLKHLLSQLPEAAVTVENVGENDTDLKLEARRSLLVELCQDDQKSLQELIQEVVQKASEASPLPSVHSVELVGGGCRIPWVKETIEAAFATIQPEEGSLLSYSLDDTSAAMGAALVEASGIENLDFCLARSSFEEPTEQQQTLLADEEAMAAFDQQMHERSAILNKLEAYILEWRSARNNVKHGSLLKEELFAFLDQTEDWLFSEEVDSSTNAQLMEKWDQVRGKVEELSKDYREALQNEKVAKEAEMEAEAKLAQLERDGAEADGDNNEDHDNRRLPKKRRMEIVLKNKKEGGELFSDGNYKFAAARYAKALSHCAKFVDLAPDDVAEVNAVKLTLNMNLALAYIKMKNADQALRYANDAVAIDDQHTKALYRRASVYYEKKNWSEASKDLKKASKAAPEDKAIFKLQEKVDAQIKRQQLKEKKMAKKMFG